MSPVPPPRDYNARTHAHHTQSLALYMCVRYNTSCMCVCVCVCVVFYACAYICVCPDENRYRFPPVCPRKFVTQLTCTRLCRGIFTFFVVVLLHFDSSGSGCTRIYVILSVRRMAFRLYRYPSILYTSRYTIPSIPIYTATHPYG